MYIQLEQRLTKAEQIIFYCEMEPISDRFIDRFIHQYHLRSINK